jgi:hypothetical protein
MFGFGKKLPHIANEDVERAMHVAMPTVKAVCDGNAKLAALRDGLPAFVRENNLDADVLHLARAAGTAHWMAELEGVSDKDVVKANPALSNAAKALAGYQASLGFRKGAQLATAVGQYCAVWAIAARGAKEVVSACLSTDR